MKTQDNVVLLEKVFTQSERPQTGNSANQMSYVHVNISLRSNLFIYLSSQDFKLFTYDFKSNQTNNTLKSIGDHLVCSRENSTLFDQF